MAGLPETAGCYLWVLWCLDVDAAEARAEQIRQAQNRRSGTAR